MTTKQQYDISFDEFMTPKEALGAYSDQEKEQLEQIYNTITDNMKTHGIDDWRIDRPTFMGYVNQVEYGDEPERIYVTLNEHMGDYITQSAHIYEESIGFDGEYAHDEQSKGQSILDIDELKFMTSLQSDLNTLVKTHSAFQDNDDTIDIGDGLADLSEQSNNLEH